MFGQKQIIPSGAVLVESRDEVSVGTLWPEEWEAIKSAVGSRQREYATVRDCARTALVKLGLFETAILNDENRCPIWPEGIVGALTHCRGYAAAVLAKESDLPTIGLDGEPAEPLPPGVLRKIATNEDRTRVEKLTHEDPTLPWDRLVCSMKESVYKAWYPLSRQPLGFHEVEVDLQPTGQCEISFLRTVSPIDSLQWQARWTIDSGILVTLVWGIPR